MSSQSQIASLEEDEKKDTYASEVLPVADLESNKTEAHLHNGAFIYDNIPDGVDPNIVREEKVIRGLKQRHIQMMALAGAIGTGLFLGSGRTIYRTGPAGAFLCYTIIGGLVMCVMGSIAEMSALAPVSGAFVRHAELFVDPALGFAIGWSCFYGSAVSVPAEWTAVAVVVSYWSDLNPGVWIAICIVVTFATNLFFIRIYGEVEFIFAMLKILLLVGLIFFGIIYDLGGIPGKERIGFYYWQNPGAWGQGYYWPGTTKGQVAGFFISFINAVYSYSGVETLAIAAAETKNPRRNIPRAAKKVFIRVAVFYCLTIFIVGLIVPSNQPGLSSNKGTAASSPFTLAAKAAGVNALPSIINAVVVTSAWSSGNHGMLTGSRSLYALALDGQAPKIFKRISRFGIPYVAVIFQGSFQLLAFMSLGSDGAGQAFEWLTNLNSSSTLCIWIVIGICNWRMRKAMKVQGISPDLLPYKAPGQPWLAQISIWGSTFLILIGGFYSFLPGNWDIADFFSSYFSIMFMFVAYFGYKLVKRTKMVPLESAPIMDFIRVADANPEPERTVRKGPMGWFARFWWD